MDDLFLDTETGAETGSMSEAALVKALSVGYGTDSAEFRGGRAMVPEDCEMTMINAMREQKEDCKMMNLIKKQPVKSTVHEYNRRLDVGDYENATADEGGGSVDSDQEIERVTRMVKYIQIRRAVTDQAEIINGFENAFESEKLAGTIEALKAAERLCFHGDSEVVPTEYDGIPKQILASTNPNITDLRGKSLGAAGEDVLSEMLYKISDRGGEANKLFLPLVLGMDLQALCRDRLRFGVDDKAMTTVFNSYPTPYGTIQFGENEGVDKMYRVKGVVSPNGNAQKRPGAPTAVAVAAANAKSQFATADAGNYKYTIHAVNKYGISTGFPLAAAVAVAAGNGVTLTITPDANNPGTGFIICRSSPSFPNVVMELARIGKDKENATTTFVDVNDDLPGTASMLFLTEKKLQTIIQFDQLIPLRMRPLWESNEAKKPFFIQLFGTADVKVPEWCGIMKNIAFKGGLY
ncbi:hypothetical protein FACS189447_03280 [Spirochaetia bacterium]|nr:hypothetical protein FACS189447_03280 [Spirochaetia bacterium]